MFIKGIYIDNKKKTLRWRIMPPTLMIWLNWYVSQWDLYISSFEENKQLMIEKYEYIAQFKTPDEESYHLFRKLCQVSDLIMMDYFHLQFENRKIIASSIFICLCFIYIPNTFSVENISNKKIDKLFFNSLLFGNRREFSEENIFGCSLA
jgi:hypothetical protein